MPKTLNVLDIQKHPKGCFCMSRTVFGGVLKSMLTLNEAIIDVKEG